MKATLALMLAIGPLLFAGCATPPTALRPLPPPPPPPGHWTYEIVHTLKGVNERAAQGGIVVSFVITPNGEHEYLIKKPQP